MEKLVITNDEFQQALCWINGEESPMGEESVHNMVKSIIKGFRKSFAERNPQKRLVHLGNINEIPLTLKHFLSSNETEISRNTKEIQKLVSVIEKRQANGNDRPISQSPNSADNNSGERENGAGMFLDSSLLVEAIAHVARTAGTELSKSRTQLILYCLYGCALGADKRLHIEHPQMWKYGPVFPRAYKSAKISQTDDCRKSWEKLLDIDLELAATLRAKTHAMMNTATTDLEAVHMGPRSPYGKLLKRNPDKWGIRIPDEDIKSFFSSNSIR